MEENQLDCAGDGNSRSRERARERSKKSREEGNGRRIGHILGRLGVSADETEEDVGGQSNQMTMGGWRGKRWRRWLTDWT